MDTALVISNWALVVTAAAHAVYFLFFKRSAAVYDTVIQKIIDEQGEDFVHQKLHAIYADIMKFNDEFIAANEESSGENEEESGEESEGEAEGEAEGEEGEGEAAGEPPVLVPADNVQPSS